MEAQVMSESSDRPDYLKFKPAMKALNWTQEDLARKAGYKLSTIQKVVTGKYKRLLCLNNCKKALGEAYDDAIPQAMPSSTILDGRWHMVTCFKDKDVGKEEFDVEVTGCDQSITARATCIKGRDRGFIYVVEGTFANLVLRATWSCADPTRIETGAVCLMLLENGNVLTGLNVHYHTKKRKLCVTPLTWRRVTVQKRSRTR
jgi:hypothetical protein